MKAIILAGGYGTRLRPLTFTVPKSVVDFIDRPIICHQLNALKKVGVTEVILALCHETDKVHKTLLPYAEELNIKLSLLIEKVPLGTAGCLSLASEYLAGEQCFFMLNSDVICDFPFEELLKKHKEKNAEVTMLTTNVSDPSKYGVVVHDSEGKVLKFVEKPRIFCGSEINAGIYIINSKMISRVKPIPTSIEKEIFPQVVNDGGLYCYELNGFWKDIGQPKDYIEGAKLFLEYEKKENFIHETSKVGEGCEIGPNVVIGKNCVIGSFTKLKNCIIFPGCEIGNGVLIEDAIIGWSSKIGNWSHVYRFSVLGEDVTINEQVILRGTSVLPHKSIAEDTLSPNRIVM